MRFFILASMLLMIISPSQSLAAQKLSNVGIHIFSATYSPTNSQIKGIIWYPTSAETHKRVFGPYKLEVAEDGMIEAGKHPLVVISHGSRGSHMGHRDTAIYLANRGYMVVSLLHPKNNFLDDSAGRTRDNWINRPQHVSTVLDWILKNTAYAHSIDDKRISIIGHSTGGYTALALVGGLPDMSGITAYCEDQNDATRFCGIYDSFDLKRQRVLSSTQRNKKDPLGYFRDTRIKAAVLMAPVGVLFRDKTSLLNVTVPVLIFRAEKDDILLYPCHADAIKRKLPLQSKCIVVKKAGHYSFLAPFPKDRKTIVGAPAEDPYGFDRIAFHKEMNEEIVKFLTDSLGH
ncbi:alpha/beta hydrolase family protein [Maridesulfovibrio zosterae]|uniref:alpha/beta hydrolase family protein n=1 Tax=Maridesulfovibrio zosterae TaxID=82171 RepID=UPI0003FD4882|nr:dienelactone hydrolase family protein [Maridesulfovibrio zosterae]